jgi:dTDP-4-amino-4,6-dideoxygalactose transaminase
VERAVTAPETRLVSQATRESIERFEEYLRRVRDLPRFTYTKLNHGYWEKLQELGDPDSYRAKMWAFLVVDGFRDELAALLRAVPPPDDESFVLGVGIEPYRGSGALAGIPVRPQDVVPLIEAHVPDWRQRDDCFAFRDAAFDGRIAGLFGALRERPNFVVGPAHLAAADEFIRSEHFDFLEIPIEGVHEIRFQVEAELLGRLRGVERPVVLIQAGSMATWLACRLHGTLEAGTVLDLGRALDIVAPEMLLSIHEGEMLRGQLIDVWGDHPAWGRQRRRREQIERLVADEAAAPEAGARPIPFVPTKEVDPAWQERLWALSARQHHWANYGPVSRVLERHIHEALALPATQRVVSAANATLALEAVAAAYDAELGRSTRWVVSAFGFPCTTLGPFAEATILDCTPRGMLDPRLLREVPEGAYDAIVVTNPFGLGENFDWFVDFAEQHGKRLLFDNATAYDMARPWAGRADEVISFHHTKPWGFGEGGVAIVAEGRADLVRAMTNYGLGEPAAAGVRWASNAKLSDAAAGMILGRLATYDDWFGLWRAQYRRIASAAYDRGLQLLGPRHYFPRHLATPASVPIILPEPRPLADLANPWVVVRKYYRPLRDGCEQAQRIFDHIVNVPCHPAMSRLSREELVAFLDFLAGS